MHPKILINQGGFQIRPARVTDRAYKTVCYARASWSLYLVIFLFGIHLKLFRGLYLHDIVVIFSMMWIIPRITVKKRVALYAISAVSLFLATALLNPGRLDLESFYLPWNVFIFFLYYVFFLYYKRSLRNLNYNIVMLFFLVPIGISCAMFLFPSVERLALEIYDSQRYPAYGRYGGIYGRDVNAFGLISSLMLFFSLVLYKLQRVNKIVFLATILLSALGIFLSGMRAGLIVIFFVLLLFNWKLRIVTLKQIAALPAIVFTAILVSGFIFSDKYINYIIQRFSADRLIRDLSAGPEGGNLRSALNYFTEVLGGTEITARMLFFGVDSSLSFVDNLYVFIFLKHGLIVLLAVSLFLLSVTYVAILRRNYILILLIIFSAILSLKGIFVLSNIYMFLFVFLYTIWHDQSLDSVGSQPRRKLV